MTKDFAKLFRTDDLGQILARLAEDHDGDTGITLTIERDGLWIDATLKIRGGDWDTAQAALERMTEERAASVLRQTLDMSGLDELFA